jgi:hypothetical protein
MEKWFHPEFRRGEKRREKVAALREALCCRSRDY